MPPHSNFNFVKFLYYEVLSSTRNFKVVDSMGVFEQKRLDFLFELESIKSPLMFYIAPGVNLKIVTDLGYKDKDGFKRRFYEETRYKSNKYKNTDYLVSSTFRINTYLVLEYPNQNYDKSLGNMKSNGIVIRAYAMDDLASKVREINDSLIKSFTIKNNELCLLSDKVKEVVVYPSMTSSIKFSPDIYETSYNDKPVYQIGVRMTFNDEYSIVVSGENTWPEFVYKITKCDLTMLGFQMIQSYMSLLPGMAVSEIGDNNIHSSTSRYRPFVEDPDDIINSESSVKVGMFKPLSKKGKGSFFDNK